MKLPLRFWTGHLLTAAGLVGIIGCSGAAPVPVTLYDADPQHPWNRLYAALLTGNPEADPTGADILDPPLFQGKFLLEGPSREEAMARLAEFVCNGAAPGAMKPIQRAVMQRDLLAVFHWMARRAVYQEIEASTRGLLTALSLAVRQVALTAGEMAGLPDNYAAAVRSGVPVADDPARPAAFLPADLMSEDGPWIALQRTGDDGLSAPIHHTIFAGRSQFEVRMRHPEGRDAGMAYLKKLAEMPLPFVMEKPADGSFLQPFDRGYGPWPNPATPQFPAGTMWALVRRAVLVTPGGQPVPSPLVESVQIRIYRSFETREAVASTSEAKTRLAAVVPERRDAESYAILMEKMQTIFEWEARHELWLNGGGLHLTQPEDLRFGAFPEPRPTLRTGQLEPLMPAGPIVGFCIQCHVAPGIFGVQSRAGVFQPAMARPPEFRAARRQELDAALVTALQPMPAWLLLKWLMTTPAAR